MSKISKKLRAEAIELAGIRATFWADDSDKASPGNEVFREEVGKLVDLAEARAGERNGEWGYAHESAEAQAMLLEGWSPS